MGSVAADAKRELFAARYENAAQLYSQVVAKEPENGDAWYGLVRAQLSTHHSRDAYASAEKALKNSPHSAGAQTAAGCAAFRHGDLPGAERFYQAALKIDPQYPGALSGLASINSAVSRFKTARDLRMRAYKASPEDPELMVAYANTLKDDQAHIAALAAALARLDPASDEARRLRVHIADDRVVAGRKLRRLISPYENSTVKLLRITDGPSHQRGVGIAIRLNGKQTARLLLDTGASGVAISPKQAEHAGLEVISGEASDFKGIGDEKPQSSTVYIAPELRIGDVVFADYPISAFRSAKSSSYDGIIGPDVLERYIVRLDFAQLLMSLETRPKNPEADSDEPIDWTGPPAPGFFRIFRFGNHLAVPTFLNGGRSALFLVDSGSSVNLIDTDVAKEYTKVSNDSRTILKGLQGQVKEISRASKISLQFAGFRQENSDLIAISFDKLDDGMGVGFGGLLGMPILAQLATTIDYRAGTIRFEYRKP
jgi:tetratricopeptide (TPR) repeat protein